MTLFWPRGLDVYPQYPRRKPFRKATDTVPVPNGYFTGIHSGPLRYEQHIRIVGFWQAPDGVVHIKKISSASGHPELVRTGCGRNRNGLLHQQLLAQGLPNKPDIPLMEFTTTPMRVTCDTCIKQADEWAMDPEFRARRRELRNAAKERGRLKRRNYAIRCQWYQLWCKALLLQTAPMFLVLLAYEVKLEVYDLLNRQWVAAPGQTNWQLGECP